MVKSCIKRSGRSGVCCNGRIMEKKTTGFPERPDNNGRKISVGYLLRESFDGRRGKTSGWEYTNLMSREDTRSPAGHVYDTTHTSCTALYKKFLRQENEKFTVDLRITVTGENAGSRISIQSGDAEAALLEISDNKLFYITYDPQKKIDSDLVSDLESDFVSDLVPGRLTGLRLAMDLEAGLLDIWVNGKITNKGKPFTTKARFADGIRFASVESGVSDFVVNAIEIYKGFSLYENLFITPGSEIPDNWEVSYSGDSLCDSYDYEPTFRGMEFTVFRLLNKAPGGFCRLESSFEIAGSGVYQFDFFLEDTADGFFTGVYGKSGTMEFYTKGGDLYFNSSAIGGETRVISPVREKVWYRIQLLLDSQNQCLTVNTNGFEAYSSRLSGDILEGAFSRIRIASSKEAVGNTCIDRICIKPMISRRSVPKPEILDTGDLIVNMQVCNLWREGTHFGWRVYTENFRNRKPILGWYDESDPEVADWEIKWALEHGIKSFMYCWYRPNITYKPFKQGRNEDQLWEGYFNSAFKKDLKFTVMLTNHATSNVGSSDDMLDNIMPYFIETFFKNPNYLKTSDNKPILYIYQMSELLKMFKDPAVEGSTGTPEDVRKMFDQMRNLTREAGFGGLVILGEYRGKDPSVIKKMSDCGYDYCFAYTWHPEYHNIRNEDMLAQIKDYMITQRNLFDEYGGTTQVIPNVSVAWDPTAWRLDFGQELGKTYTFDLEHLEALLKWARDDFGTPALDEGGTKIMMIDNWNEYGEGHYFLPAYGTPAYDLDEQGKAGGENVKKGKKGFGWLDCIRKVYGKDPFEHTDHWPLEEGFGPYDKWFPPAWDEEDVNADEHN
jgi:hypothetical protein